MSLDSQIIQYIYCQYRCCRYIYGNFIQYGMKNLPTQRPKNNDPSKSRAILVISKNIKHFRMQIGISQELLAELSGLHRNYIGQCERGEVNISVLNLEAIAKALNIKIYDLVRRNSVVNYNE